MGRSTRATHREGTDGASRRGFAFAFAFVVHRRSIARARRVSETNGDDV